MASNPGEISPDMRAALRLALRSRLNPNEVANETEAYLLVNGCLERFGAGLMKLVGDEVGPAAFLALESGQDAGPVVAVFSDLVRNLADWMDESPPTAG